MLTQIKTLTNHYSSWLIKITLSKIVISIIQNAKCWSRPDKSVMILELKIHFPNYKILDKKILNFI